MIYGWVNILACLVSTSVNWVAGSYKDNETLGYAAISLGWICSTIMFVGFIYHLHLFRSWEGQERSVKVFGYAFHVLLALFLNVRNTLTNDFLAVNLFVTRNHVFYDEVMRSYMLQNFVIPLCDAGTVMMAGAYYMAVVRSRQVGLKEDAGLEDLVSMPCCVSKNSYRKF